MPKVTATPACPSGSLDTIVERCCNDRGQDRLITACSVLFDHRVQRPCGAPRGRETVCFTSSTRHENGSERTESWLPLRFRFGIYSYWPIPAIVPVQIANVTFAVQWSI